MSTTSVYESKIYVLYYNKPKGIRHEGKPRIEIGYEKKQDIQLSTSTSRSNEPTKDSARIK